MRVLVACEFSGIVRDAFVARGHDAWSCDLLPTERPGKHYQDDIRAVLNFGPRNWDLMIAHPPCTYLTVSNNGPIANGCKLYTAEEAKKRRAEAIEFFMFLINASRKIPKVGVENPIGIMSTLYRKADQYIQPWQFGHPESKKTCLWLHGLPKLVSTNILPLPPSGRWENQTASGQNRLAPSATRSQDRARTYQGIADAMAEQWGGVVR